LKKRHTAIKSVHAWYKTIDRVTHSLTEKPKLYNADIKDALEPVLDNGETYPHHNLYYIQSDIWDLEVLGGHLMSAVGQFFVESYGVRMRGGYLRFQAQYLRRIRVPSPDALSKAQMQALREAFSARDKPRATQVALDVYKISPHESESKRPVLPSGTESKLGLTMGSWFRQRDRERNVVFAGGDRLQRSGGS
jgi:adenine-specific DNA-methyltransferase